MAMSPPLPTSPMGNYAQPAWRIDRSQLAGRSPAAGAGHGVGALILSLDPGPDDARARCHHRWGDPRDIARRMTTPEATAGRRTGWAP
jgi:hypothetical protein